MTAILLLALISVVVAVWWWVKRRSGRTLAARVAGAASGSSGLYLLVYDGSLYDLYPAVWSDEDQSELVPVSGGTPYPRGAVKLLRAAGGLTVGVVAFSSEVLAEHALMRRARQNVDLSAMFTGGGDSRKFWALASTVVPIVVLVILWFQIGGSLGRQDTLLVKVGAIEKTVNDGLTCKVTP